MSLADRAATPPTTASRIQAAPFQPSARELRPDCYELTTESTEVAEMVAELALLGILVPPGTKPRLVEAKHDPAAWHRDTEFVPHPGRDGEMTKAPAVTRPVVRRKWVFDWSVPAQDVSALVSFILKRKSALKRPKDAKTRVGAFVVCLADLQIGKVDVRGGTDELLQVLDEKLEKVTAIVKSTRPARIIVADLGDCIENFDNTVVQAHTNDRTLPEQIDLINAITLRICLDLADHAPVDYVAVPSNHGQWRRGGSKGSAAKPSDDWGILNAQLLARTFHQAGRDDITVTVPETYAESLSLDVAGLPIGFVHGHQVNKPDMLPSWWKGQAFGNHPVAAAKLLVSGHFHHLNIKQVSEDRYIFGCPSMDGGSTWLTNVTGDSSGRGLLTFTVTDGQWDNLRII